MIACDAAQCPYEWFHLPCVGLEEVDGREKWFCPVCSVREGGATRILDRPAGSTSVVASGSASARVSATLSVGVPTSRVSPSLARAPLVALDPRIEKEGSVRDLSVSLPSRALTRTGVAEGDARVDVRVDTPSVGGRNSRNERKTVRRKR